MKVLNSGLIFFLCLNTVELRWRPVSRPKEQYTVKIFPQHVDKTQLAQLKLPNKIFCAQMEKQSAGLYILMPWWYNYCQDLKEERARTFKSSNALYEPIYKTVLDRVQWHRRHKRTTARGSNVMWFRDRP